MRKFNINAPLQILDLANNKINSRFYCPLPLKDVEVWVKPNSLLPEILIAKYDSIPAFSDASFDFAIYDYEMEFITSAG